MLQLSHCATDAGRGCLFDKLSRKWMKSCVCCTARPYSFITSAYCRAVCLLQINLQCSFSLFFFFSCKAQQRLILDIDTSMFVLLSSFGSNAGVCGAEGIQTLSASITLPFPSAYSPFSRIMQAQLFSPSKGELVIILRFAFARRVSSQRVQTWMFSVQSWTECMWVWNQKPSSHNDTNAASLGKQTPLLYPSLWLGSQSFVLSIWFTFSVVASEPSSPFLWDNWYLFFSFL